MHVEPEHTYITISTSAQQIQELIPHLKTAFLQNSPRQLSRKSPHPFARYTKEAYICLLKNRQLSWYSKTYDGYSVLNMAWKVMKDYAEYQGYTDIRSSRDAIRKALEMGLIDDKQWTETIEARNLTSHNHDNDVVSEEKMQSLNTPSLFD